MSLSANFFELFELPVSFDINKNALAERYRELQRVVHPDKYVNAPDRERRLAMQKATQINEAFQTLKEPLSRASYLLELQGIDLKQNATITDEEFLGTQMDFREDLGDIKEQEQQQPLDALYTLMSHIKKHQDNLINTFSQQFAQENWQDASDTVRKLQFFARLHEEALELEEELIIF